MYSWLLPLPGQATAWEAADKTWPRAPVRLCPSSPAWRRCACPPGRGRVAREGAAWRSWGYDTSSLGPPASDWLRGKCCQELARLLGSHVIQSGRRAVIEATHSVFSYNVLLWSKHWIIQLNKLQSNVLPSIQPLVYKLQSNVMSTIQCHVYKSMSCLHFNAMFTF